MPVDTHLDPKHVDLFRELDPRSREALLVACNRLAGCEVDTVPEFGRIMAELAVELEVADQAA